MRKCITGFYVLLVSVLTGAAVALGCGTPSTLSSGEDCNWTYVTTLDQCSHLKWDSDCEKATWYDGSHICVATDCKKGCFPD